LLRIISGAYKGRKLHSFPGLSIRPTSDRTRESIFNILSSRYQSFTDKRVLDLYAGTGALGIEALSRGARSAIFVESHKDARAVLQKNLAFITGPAAYEIIGLAVQAALPLLQGRGGAFDLIFIDPPYGQGLVSATMEALASGTLCSSQAIILCEHFMRDTVEERYGALSIFDKRRYGQTTVSFYALSGEAGVNAP
jgi:16S rRNA (guanine(966)-N(2))-methyltransferase RsmD